VFGPHAGSASASAAAVETATRASKILHLNIMLPPIVHDQSRAVLRPDSKKLEEFLQNPIIAGS
jgi:hypothetical protein